MLEILHQINFQSLKKFHRILTGWVAPMECFTAWPVTLLTRAKQGKPSSSFTRVLSLSSLYQCCNNNKNQSNKHIRLRGKKPWKQRGKKKSVALMADLSEIIIKTQVGNNIIKSSTIFNISWGKKSSLTFSKRKQQNPDQVNYLEQRNNNCKRVNKIENKYSPETDRRDQMEQEPPSHF